MPAGSESAHPPSSFPQTMEVDVSVHGDEGNNNVPCDRVAISSDSADQYSVTSFCPHVSWGTQVVIKLPKWYSQAHQTLQWGILLRNVVVHSRPYAPPNAQSPLYLTFYGYSLSNSDSVLITQNRVCVGGGSSLFENTVSDASDSSSMQFGHVDGLLDTVGVFVPANTLVGGVLTVCYKGMHSNTYVKTGHSPYVGDFPVSEVPTTTASPPTTTTTLLLSTTTGTAESVHTDEWATFTGHFFIEFGWGSFSSSDPYDCFQICAGDSTCTHATHFYNPTDGGMYCGTMGDSVSYRTSFIDSQQLANNMMFVSFAKDPDLIASETDHLNSDIALQAASSGAHMECYRLQSPSTSTTMSRHQCRQSCAQSDSCGGISYFQSANNGMKYCETFGVGERDMSDAVLVNMDGDACEYYSWLKILPLDIPQTTTTAPTTTTTTTAPTTTTTASDAATGRTIMSHTSMRFEQKHQHGGTKP